MSDVRRSSLTLSGGARRSVIFVRFLESYFYPERETCYSHVESLIQGIKSRSLSYEI
jgi:hypothetical protein